MTSRKIRILRANYDKPHRCPAWSGPGWAGCKKDTCGVTYTGSIRGFYDHRFWQFRVNRHECGAIVLPVALKWLEPRTWWIHTSRLRERSRGRRL